jgi:hypothetical protein
MSMVCQRQYGGSVRYCDCKLPDGGWAACPPEARGILAPMPPQARPASFSGDICDYCGSAQMMRTGACLTCMNCGESGGCG